MKRLMVLFFTLFFLVTGLVGSEVRASQEEAVQLSEEQAPSRFSIGLKGGLHLYWKTGLLANPAEYGRPGMGVTDLLGFCGEVDLNYHMKDYLVLTVTGGGYEASSEEYDISFLTGYGLLTVNLVSSRRSADYYVGFGVGGYWSHIDADGTAEALKPGIHGTIGVRISLAPGWSLILEDRLAYTLQAKGGFGDMNLGGNFFLIGCSYRF